MINKLILELGNNPKKIFLVDLSGALFSAFMLGVVFVCLQSYIGLSKSFLYILAFIPCCFALYDFLCYKFAKKSFYRLIRIIALANLAYCICSLVIIMQHYDSLTFLALGYFIAEIIIVALIAYWELLVSKK